MIEVLKQMVKALEAATVDCSNFHHAKKDQNHHLGECPPVIRWHHAIEAGKRAIAELESQEPFGYVNRDEVVEHMGLVSCGTIYRHPAEGRLALYTHPPQRTAQEWFSEVIGNALFDFQEATGCDTAEEFKAQRTWVGLTDEQMLECNMDGDLMIDRETAKRNVEAKLKEKNNG